LQRLKSGKLPKFSIANGNWVGELPPELRKMSYGGQSAPTPQIGGAMKPPIFFKFAQ